VLAACNYGTVRYALYRETGLNVSSLFGTEDKEIQTPVEDVEINEVQSSAENQIKQSDNMRGDLVKWGIEEIKKNPAFGTGNVLFRYVINEKRAFEQSSHNFVIESIICYGIVGLLLIGVMFACMLVKTDLYRKKNWYKWRDAVAMLLCVVYYFAFGFVQPTVYAPMICSLFVLLIYTFARDGLRDAQTEPAADKT
jgi:O-antigen ligase